MVRERRPDLRISSDVLLATAMLLCPLNLTAATRLINLASATPGLLVIAILAAAAVVAGIYFAAMLAGGLMDRSLDRRHAQFFVALSSIQLLVPWIGQVTHWYWLAAAHLILLGLLGGALFAFANEWVRSVFVDRRRMAYYTAGLLVFAAVVSFAHLTWSYSGPLPRGYAAPFLMALSGLLFFVDTALKAWARQHVYLSRFTFALYGVSVVALLLSWQTDLPQLLTLILGAIIYGFVLYRYLSPPPMYLLLVCLGWLYADLVLEMLPRDWHLLASLPPLGVLFWGGRGLASRAPSLAQICMWTLLAGFTGLTGWTLLGSEPGWLAFFSALTATGFVRYAGRVWPVESRWVDEQGDFPRWRYLVALLAGLSVVYAPSLIGELQLSFGLAVLAAGWTLMGLHGVRVSRESLEDYTNSALIALALSVAFSVYVVFQQSFSPAAVITLSWKGLIEGPLRQAAVLLWLVGGWRLWGQVLSGQITWEWVAAAGIATLAAFLLIAQLRVLWLSFVPVALGLGVTLGIGHQFDLGFDGLCILTTTYALALWMGVPRVLATSSMTRLGEFLGLAGGHGAAGGRVRVRAAIHGTGLAVLIIALIGVSLDLIFGAAIRPDVLWTFGLAALFFWLTGWHYRSRFHSYFVLLTVMEPGLR